ncbi:MAG: type IV toxin-antitoxin system AbiEi family antitoxin domain-containing protein [Actinobacteria bacterium]|nr:type IV toxin-antitoxin system AbiEi family antitoxin domain-containing protein [Actinomycetota bacterium]MBV9253220.1 type IV toxin-antitoxin system AbiEi family antitoxin domain-containing protein [Actinomycetota bacterium]MBV9665691.1 type IV toxin-antitoxin system AbiEi family antitoxin domain-containing protein [Actinomycetota bacterium]
MFTTAHARDAGMTEMALRWGVRAGKWLRAAHGVYADGAEPLSALDRARARVLSAKNDCAGAACWGFASP